MAVSAASFPGELAAEHRPAPAADSHLGRLSI
jgi:hypothetical protein